MRKTTADKVGTYQDITTSAGRGPGKGSRQNAVGYHPAKAGCPRGNPGRSAVSRAVNSEDQGPRP